MTLGRLARVALQRTYDDTDVWNTNEVGYVVSRAIRMNSNDDPLFNIAITFLVAIIIVVSHYTILQMDSYFIFLSSRKMETYNLLYK